MRKLTKLTIFTVILLMVSWVSPVGATSPPVDVQFVLDLGYDENGSITGPFVATGTAVDAGLICPDGYTLNIWGFATPVNSDGTYTFHLIKGYFCSGSDVDVFLMRVDGKADNITGTYNWTITKGFGRFDKLHGTGTATVEYADPYNFVDTLIGQVHID